jgi:PAS domain S-box-containing protein
MRLFQRLSFKSKLLVLILAMVTFIGGTVGILIRIVIFPYLVNESGRNAAERLVEAARTSILQRDSIRLTAILFEAKAIDKSIANVAITDETGAVLAHTFLNSASSSTFLANNGSGAVTAPEVGWWTFFPRLPGQSQVTMPILEGQHQIGAIRVWLHPQYMDRLIFELRICNLLFIGFVMLAGLPFGLYLSRIITRPVQTLTAFAKEISLGNLNARLALGNRAKCSEVLECANYSCPAYGSQTLRCWFIDGACCVLHGPLNFPEKLEACKRCPVYIETAGDEIVQLADTFNHMASRLSASEQELRNSENRHRWLFNSGPHPIFVVSAETCLIQDANDRAADIYGFEKERLIGMNFTELMFDEQAREEIREAFLISMSTGACSLIPKIRRQNSEGGPLWVNIYFCPDNRAGGSDLIVTTADISDFIKAEIQLVQAGKLATLGEMATGVAHELNQPLNAIKLGSEYLLKMAETGQQVGRFELSELAGDLSREVDRAAGIINHLRQFGRKSDVVTDRIDINRPIRGVFTILGQQLSVHGIEVQLDLDENLPPIMADENRLEQVFVNLVNNARDAMLDRTAHAGPNVLTIKSFLENHQVTVTVSDTGPGIPESIRGRIFEPFFTTKKPHKGTGLGLSISYGIVRDYKGTIDFLTGEGTGATFIVSFPEAPQE